MGRFIAPLIFISMADNVLNKPQVSTVNPVAASAVSAGSGFLGGLVSAGTNIYLAHQQQKWNEQMMDKQNQFSLDMWNKTNEYNDPTHQLQRLRDAGLNPLYFGLDGSSANSFESAQPLGYDRANMQNIGNPIGEGINAYTQLKSLEKDIELKNAQIDKLNADTSGVKLDNDFKDKTMDARVQAQELANSMTKESIDKVKSEKNQIEANIKKISAETDNEIAKKLLIEAQTNLNKMQEKEIAELLPYRKLLTAAQTEAQKAAASASFYNAMMNKGLIDGGYIDSLLDKAASEADDASARSAIDAFKASVRSGNVFSIDGNDWFLTKQGKQFFNGLFNAVSIVGEAVTGPIAGLFK